ncbi:chaperone NapD [Lysobacter sp.]|uniref:chaperone NapD n=1 Tax=Lysobacter sp. TaxID=72226 RepID=UPI002D653F8E|nr:chaperone NapD [Lysobacter sp.]HZX78865.1 chaperone NapD [Lysobacter sp.]
MNGTLSADLHIASLVVQHREDAMGVLDEYIDAVADAEVALRGATRSIVLCECSDQYAVLDRMDALRALPGVFNVALVYHHAEPRDALDGQISTNETAGAAP